MIPRIATLAAISILAASCAPQPGSPPEAQAPQSARDCFFLSQVSGYTHAGRNKIRVSTGPRQTYEFETLGSCPELENAEAMGFDPAGAGTICRGIDVDLIVPTSTGPRRCAVSMIRKVEQDGTAE